MTDNDATIAWLKAVHYAINGTRVAPRGQPTREVLHTNIVQLDMNWPVVAAADRGLNYKFMAAEALWITRGDDQVAPLAKHVPRMLTFSDDGETLAGAYGPRIVSQLSYVVNALTRDPDTRQAALTIWTPNPKPSKDIPCTISLVFSLRDGRLHCHANMRSSDVWLGIPYDVFSFSMVSTMVLCQLNTHLPIGQAPYRLGQLTVTAASSHIYESDVPKALKVINELRFYHSTTPVPKTITDAGQWDLIVKSLKGMEANGTQPTIGGGPWCPVRRNPEQLALHLGGAK